MPSSDVTRATGVPAGHRRNLLLIVVLLIGGALVLTVVTGGGGSAESGPPGPTVVAEPRDLATTLEASGNLQRSGEQTVTYAGELASDDGTGQPDDAGGDGGDGGDGSDAEPVSYLTGPSSTSSSSSTTSSTMPSTTPTTSPCSPTSTSSTSSSSTPSTTPSTTPCPTTTSTTSTTSTTTPSSTTPTTTPTPSSTTPTTPPSTRDGSGTRPPSAGDPVPTDGGSGASGPRGGPPADGAEPTGSGEPTGGDDPTGNDVPSATLTSLLDVGATARRGTVLFTADDEPVVALIGDLPAWRTMEEGVGDGADVRQLEENLVALGYGAGLDVDETFTAATAAAVEAWETDLGRAAPDGAVTIGDVVFITAPGDVLGHEAAVGDTLDAGSPVLTIGSEQRIVVADVDATEAGGWTPGSTVELEWADGTISEGTVFGTGREATAGQVELIVAVGTGDSGAGDRRSGAATSVTLVDARRDGVVAVPVSAIVDDGGSPAVRVAQADGPDRIVPVDTGLAADGWVEITTGLDGGEEIRLPG